MATESNLNFSERKLELLGEKLADVLNLKARKTHPGARPLYKTTHGPKTALGLGRAVMDIILDAAVATEEVLASEVQEIKNKKC